MASRGGERKVRKPKQASRFGSILHLAEIKRGYGDEPIWEGVKLTDENYQVKLTNALNWAHAAFDTPTLKAITLDYFKGQEEYSFLKDIHDQYFINGIGMQCWLRSAKAPLSEASDEFFQSCIEDMKKTYDRNAEEQELVRKQKELEEMDNRKLNADQESKLEYADMFAQLDQMIMKRDVQSEDVYSMLKSKNPSLAALRLLKDHYDTNVTDADSFNKTNVKPDIKVKRYVNNLRDFSAVILMQIAKVLNNTKAEKKLTKAVRAPRRKKIKPANMQVAKLQFKERDEGLKLVSIPPTALVNSQTLVVFNTKTRKVGMYYAKTTDGLTVKGTTIQNFDEEKSFQKTLRKPEDLIPQLIEVSAHRYEKVFATVKAVSTKLNGRVSTDILLLKVFKLK